MKALIAFLFIMIATQANAQLAFEKGTKTIQAGLGLGANYFYGSVKTPPLQVKYEQGVTEEISIGGIVGHASSKQSLYNANYSYTLIGTRGNYHFGTTDKFDAYAGGTLGYNIIKAKYREGADGVDYTGPIDLSFNAGIFGFQLGANYYFSDKIGAWAEVGYGIGYLNLGATFKL